MLSGSEGFPTGRSHVKENLMLRRSCSHLVVTLQGKIFPHQDRMER